MMARRDREQAPGQHGNGPAVDLERPLDARRRRSRARDR